MLHANDLKRRTEELVVSHICVTIDIHPVCKNTPLTSSGATLTCVLFDVVAKDKNTRALHLRSSLRHDAHCSSSDIHDLNFSYLGKDQTRTAHIIC